MSPQPKNPNPNNAPTESNPELIRTTAIGRIVSCLSQIGVLTGVAHYFFDIRQELNLNQTVMAVILAVFALMIALSVYSLVLVFKRFSVCFESKYRSLIGFLALPGIGLVHWAAYQFFKTMV